jgi:hypothetical protein
MTWFHAFITLRNSIGDMEYDDFGCVGYAWTTPEWRRALADVFEWLAYHRSAAALLRTLISHFRPAASIDDIDECPF